METTINNMLFEWDEEKANLNWRKHKIDFNDALKFLLMKIALNGLMNTTRTTKTST